MESKEKRVLIKLQEIRNILCDKQGLEDCHEAAMPHLREIGRVMGNAAAKKAKLDISELLPD